MTLEEDKALLKVPDVARRLGISVPHVYGLARRGEIPCVRIGTSVRFDPEDVEEYIRAHRRKTA